MGANLADNVQNEQTSWTTEVATALQEFTGGYESAVAYNDLKARAIFREVLESGDASRFGTRYREAFANTDEQVSTASARELLFGVVRGVTPSLLRLTSDERKHLTDVMMSVYDAISRVRMPTRMTGYNYAVTGERLQHPMGAEAGMWGFAAGTGSTHSVLDRSRREYVYRVMRRTYSLTGSFSASSQWGAIAAMQFSLNAFVAPSTASDQDAYGARSSDEKDQQLSWRDAIKALAVRLGAAQAASDPTIDDNRSRDWGHRLPDGPLSPPREDDTDETAEATNPIDTYLMEVDPIAEARRDSLADTLPNWIAEQCGELVTAAVTAVNDATQLGFGPAESDLRWHPSPEDEIPAQGESWASVDGWSTPEGMSFPDLDFTDGFGVTNAGYDKGIDDVAGVPAEEGGPSASMDLGVSPEPSAPPDDVDLDILSFRNDDEGFEQMFPEVSMGPSDTEFEQMFPEVSMGPSDTEFEQMFPEVPTEVPAVAEESVELLALL
jgi:hypothetical protein